jgi:hypothetical protein
MTSLVRPELPTAALRSSHATHAAVDNSAPFATRPQSTYKSGKVVQTSGATSLLGQLLLKQRPNGAAECLDAPRLCSLELLELRKDYVDSFGGRLTAGYFEQWYVRDCLHPSGKDLLCLQVVNERIEASIP